MFFRQHQWKSPDGHPLPNTFCRKNKKASPKRKSIKLIVNTNTFRRFGKLMFNSKKKKKKKSKKLINNNSLSARVLKKYLLEEYLHPKQPQPHQNFNARKCCTKYEGGIFSNISRMKLKM